MNERKRIHEGEYKARESEKEAAINIKANNAWCKR